MTKRVAARTGARGLTPIDLPGIGIFDAKDGQVFCYLGTPGGAPWTTMVEWMTREGMAEDLNEEPNITMVRSLNLGFLTGLVREPEKLGERIAVLGHMREVFARFIASKTKWEVYEQAQQQRLMIGIVSTPEDLAKNPQLAARDWYQKVEHDHLGAKVQYTGPPFRMSETPWAIRRRPPLPGEHNNEIFTGELGVSAQELDRLQSAGVV
jgi:crotonobetainyl-CoA:carnitine CoA-transferase CaiB-like acyl-CoA transferase